MAHTKNKIKFWRKMGNKVTIQVPKTREIVNADGSTETESYDEEVTLTGRQLKQHTRDLGNTKMLTPLLKNLFKKAGIDTIVTLDDVIIQQGEATV